MYSTKLFSCSPDVLRHVSGTRKDERYFSEINKIIRFEYGIINIVIFIFYETVRRCQACVRLLQSWCLGGEGKQSREFQDSLLYLVGSKQRTYNRNASSYLTIAVIIWIQNLF